MKRKYYRVFGCVRYQFGGYDDVIVLVTKETDTKIMGYTVDRGNFNREDIERRLIFPLNGYRKITLIKKNVVGWELLI